VAQAAQALTPALEDLPAGAAGTLAGLTIAHYGHLEPEYSRNRIVAKALARAGAEVVPIDEHGRFLRRTPRLARRALAEQFDLLLVGFPGHTDMFAARALARARGVPLVFDMFVPLWETHVDRGGRRISLQSLRLRVSDRASIALADMVLLDTRTHIEWLTRDLGFPASRFRRVWAGSDDEIMRPTPLPAGRTESRVLFWGSFVGLHGIEHILNAARAVRDAGADVSFEICGDGQTYTEMRRLATDLGVDVAWLPRRPPAELAALVASCDIALGIFGGGPKAARVIPNKAFEALACRRPLITADTPGAREALVHREHAWLCPPADSDALAAAVLDLHRDRVARERIAAAGHDLFRREFGVDALSAVVADVIQEAMRRQ
jgi:glycosyltransferase involved in cell wall biosynthesis